METSTYPVRFAVDYPDRPLSRATTAFRLVAAVVAVVVAWFAIVLTDRYPPFSLR